jgi:pilus assembly protein CpaE
MRGEHGQASVEMIAAIPFLLLAALVCLQLLVAGYAMTLVDGAAEAAALADAAGEPAEEAARAALPGWARKRVEVDAGGGDVEVRVRPPVVVPGLGGLLEVSSEAHVRPPGGARGQGGPGG